MKAWRWKLPLASLAVGSGMALVVAAAGAWAAGHWWWGWTLAGGVAELLLGLGLVWWPAPPLYPGWVRPFRIMPMPAGVSLECSLCGGNVMAAVPDMSGPRLMSYMHAHSRECPGRAGEVTARLNGRGSGVGGV